MSRLQIRVGPMTDQIIREIAQEGTLAIAALERGESYEAPLVVRFESWNTLFRVLTANRVALLEHVAQCESVKSTRALSVALGRDYAAVHADVADLVRYGLLERQGTVLRAVGAIDDLEMETA